MIEIQDIDGKVQLIDSYKGHQIQIISSHKGHQGTVRGSAVNATGKLIRVAVRCECEATLWLKPEWVEAVDAQDPVVR